VQPLRCIEIRWRNTWIVLSQWQGEIAIIASATRAIAFIASWRNTRITTFFIEHSKIQRMFPDDFIWSRHYRSIKVISTRESKRSSSFGDHNLVILTSPSTLQIQDQIHHRTGSLQPLEDAQHKFIQIYFMGNMEEQLDQRQTINTAMKRAILQDLQQLLHEHHALIRLFKTVLDRMPSDDYKVVIRADK
jgi:hypothetical protein